MRFDIIWPSTRVHHLVSEWDGMLKSMNYDYSIVYRDPVAAVIIAMSLILNSVYTLVMHNAIMANFVTDELSRVIIGYVFTGAVFAYGLILTMIVLRGFFVLKVLGAIRSSAPDELPGEYKKYVYASHYINDYLLRHKDDRQFNAHLNRVGATSVFNELEKKASVEILKMTDAIKAKALLKMNTTLKGIEKDVSRFVYAMYWQMFLIICALLLMLII